MKMMEAARLKRARRRLRGYFFGSGIILAFLYILVAAFIVRLVGVELTRFWSTALIVAAVLLGGSYGIALFSSIGIHIVRRLLKRQPIMDAED
jgi:polyferredoxin